MKPNVAYASIALSSCLGLCTSVLSCGSTSPVNTSTSDGGGTGMDYHSPRENPDYNSHQAPGAAAHDLLSSDKFQSVIIEIQAMQGFEPTTRAQAALKDFITARVNKPGGVTLVVDPSIPPQNKSAYSLNEVGMLEAANRQNYTTGTQLVTYFLFLDGASTEDDAQSGRKVLAYAYQNTSMAVFEKTIKSISGTLPGQASLATVETTVVEHEFGHLLGLVNLNPGTPIQSPHQDTPHGNHCNVANCLMYYSVNTSDVVSNILSFGGNPPVLDAQCLADLRANGGK